MVLSIRTLPSLLFFANAEGFLPAEIAHDISGYYNILCMNVMHRPKEVSLISPHLKWYKWYGTSSWLTTGSLSLKEEYDWNRGIKCLQVVMTEMINPTDFAEYSKNSSLHKGLWVFYINDFHQIVELFKDAYFLYTLKIFVVQIVNESAEIHEIFRANMNLPLRITQIGTWTLQSRLELNETFILRRRSNYEKLPVKIGLLESWPSAFQINESGKQVWKGFFPSIWQHLEEALNLKTIYESSSMMGSLETNKTWSGLIGMAVRREIDVIVAELTMNERRSHYLSFSQPLFKSKYQIYFKQPGFALDWISILKPFRHTVWAAIFLWLLVTSLVYYYCYTMANKRNIETKLKSSGLAGFLFFSLQSLCQQGGSNIPNSFNCRVIYFSAYMFSTIIVPCYSASLIYSLTKKTPISPFQSISEIIKDGTYKLLVPINTAEYDYFADSQDPVLATTYKKLIKTVPPVDIVTDEDEANEKLCRQPKYAFFTIETIYYHRQGRLKNPCLIGSMVRPLSEVYLALAVKKDDPLLGIISYQVCSMFEFGLLKRITDKFWRIPESKVADSWKEVGLEEVFQIFVFLGSATILSMIILLMERAFYSKHSRSTQRSRIDYQFVN